MEPEKTNTESTGTGGFGSAPPPPPPPPTPPMPDGNGHGKDDVIKGDKTLEDLQFEVSNKVTNWPIIVLWVSAAISVLIVGGLMFMNNSLDSDIAAKSDEKAQILKSINSDANVAIEVKATAFKSAAAKLIEANSQTSGVGDFLDSFYTKIYSPVKVNNLAISSDGSFSFDGTTKSYRTIADQILILKAWDQVSDIEVGAVSNSGDGSAIAYSFSVSGTATFASAATTATSTEEEAL